MNVQVLPLAQHILRTIAAGNDVAQRIDEIIERAMPSVIILDDKARISLSRRANRFEIRGYLSLNMYKVEETKVYLNHINFPQSVTVKWDDLLALDEMKASSLIDIKPMASRKVMGYQTSDKAGATVFTLKACVPEDCISWDDLKIEMTR